MHQFAPGATRVAIAAGFERADIYKGQWQGVKDCFKHWWLILRCSWIGGGIGSIPGISASVVDWLAYGHALKTEKGASATFGKGDVRGVIGQAKLAQAGERLRGKCFVELDPVEIADLEAEPRHQLLG